MKQLFRHITFTFLFASLITVSSCGNTKSGAKEEDATATGDTTQREEGIAEVTGEQMKAVGIEMGELQSKNLASAVRATGQLTVPPQNKAVVNALVGGVIRGINVIEGQYVKRGQIVVSIENPDFIRLQQDYLTSKDNLVYLRQEFERQRQLKEADAGIGKVYQQASANYAAEQSKLRTLEAQLQQIHISPQRVSRGSLIKVVPVLAPISGTVGKITLSIGTYTDASNTIMEIVNNSTIYADLQVFEKDIAKVRTGQAVAFQLTSAGNKQVTGKVTGINKSFDSGNKTVAVHTILNNVAPLNLVAGQYVTALIETGKAMVIAVPKEAIIKAADKSYIFVFDGLEKVAMNRDADDKEISKTATAEKHRFKMIEVVTGVEELGFVAIRLVNELEDNTKVVTKGAFYLYTSMQNIETDDL